MTDTFPSLLVLRLSPSLFSYCWFLMVQWKNESKHIHKVCLTFRWISVAVILVGKKISILPPLSFSHSFTTYILASDLKRSWFVLSYKLYLTRIFHVNFNCQATEETGTRWWLNPASVEVYSHLSFRSRLISFFLKAASTSNPWRKKRKGWVKYNKPLAFFNLKVMSTWQQKLCLVYAVAFQGNRYSCGKASRRNSIMLER